MKNEDFKLKKQGEIRVRIAPSPTGPMHMGLARSALFNYLFAKKNKGIFILRIEDTDLERSKSCWEKEIIENLKWLGIEFDEGPIIEKNGKQYVGEYGPYRQSRRKEIHKKYLDKLLEQNKAYYCFCSEKELEAEKSYKMSRGELAIYSGKCRNLSSEKVKELLKEGKKPIVRFKTPSKIVKFKDLIRGEVKFDTSLLGDFSIAKNIDFSLYNFAVVVDDFEMKISHVIRGEDHISNTPKQILIQEALELPRPEYAHLPLILGSDRSKLSKRHGSVSLSEHREQGYLPEALINFMALLGWNLGTDREIFSLDSLVKEFSLEKCQKSGAVFNTKKMDWVNSFYIRQKSINDLTQLCIPYLVKQNLIKPIQGSEQNESTIENFQKFEIIETKQEIDINYLEKIVKIYQERLKNLSEISELTNFFFRSKIEYDKSLLIWKDMKDEEVIASLDKIKNLFSEIESDDWAEQDLKNVLSEDLDQAKDKGRLLWPLRVALTGEKASAGPFEISDVLGRENVLKRIEQAKEYLNE